MRETTEDIQWLISAIQRLPSDDPVPKGTQGYNVYTTQKDHWLGWLSPELGTGTYARAAGTNRDARHVYNHIGEPKMLLWLASASGVPPMRIAAAIAGAEPMSALNSKCAAIRKQIPWGAIVTALRAQPGSGAV